MAAGGIQTNGCLNTLLSLGVSEFAIKLPTMDSPRMLASSRRLSLMMEQSLGTGTPPKRSTLSASPVLGKRKVQDASENTSLQQHLSTLHSEIAHKTGQIKQLEAQLTEMQKVLAGCVDELKSAHEHLAEADRTIDVREKQVRALTVTLHETKQQLYAQDAELKRLHEALEGEREGLRVAVARCREAGQGAVEAGRMVAWEAAARGAQLQITALEKRIEQVAAKRKMEAALRLAMEDAFIEQQHHWARKHLAATVAVQSKQNSWCWCW